MAEKRENLPAKHLNVQVVNDFHLAIICLGQVLNPECFTRLALLHILDGADELEIA